MADQCIRDLSRNVKRGIESKRQKGQFPHKAPMGYINLLADKTKIKENIDSHDTRIDDWLELTEKVFDFISGAREVFISDDLEAKRAILTAVGKVITLLDGKIHIEPEEWLVHIAGKYPALEREYKMFEPAKNHSYNGISPNLEPIRTAWLAIADEVRTRIIASNKDIFIPELSF